MGFLPINLVYQATHQILEPLVIFPSNFPNHLFNVFYFNAILLFSLRIFELCDEGLLQFVKGSKNT
jgi:hypothetical protein